MLSFLGFLVWVAATLVAFCAFLAFFPSSEPPEITGEAPGPQKPASRTLCVSVLIGGLIVLNWLHGIVAGSSQPAQATVSRAASPKPTAAATKMAAHHAVKVNRAVARAPVPDQNSQLHSQQRKNIQDSWAIVSTTYTEAQLAMPLLQADAPRAAR